MKRISSFLIIIAVASCFCMTGCEDDPVKVSALTVLEAKYVDNVMQITLKDNETLQLTPFFMPQDVGNKDVIYSNKNPNMMTVSETGLITPKGFGTDTLVISAADGSGVQTSYVVKITDHMVRATGINVTADGNNILLKIGGASFDLAACVTLVPEDTWDKSVTYRSSDNGIATVSADGVVTPVAVGAAVITVTTADGSNISRECNVAVQDKVEREVHQDRSVWTVTTSVLYSDGNSYVVDGATGKPGDMFDNNAATFLSLVKPGKTYGSASGTTPGYELFFIVDTKSVQKFSYIRWQHRSVNTYAYLRVWGVDISGSNDGTNWTTIQTGVTIPIAGIEPTKLDVNQRDDNFYRIDLDQESEFRYVKINITKWSDNSGGVTSGGTVQIGEFGLGYTYFE